MRIHAIVLYALTSVVLLMQSGTVRAEWVDWIFNPGVEFRHEDNINFSAFSNDKKSDSVWRLYANGGRVYQAGERTRLRLTADVDVNRYDEWDGLNSISLGGTAALTHKFGLGLTAPWLRPYFTLGYKDVDSYIRRGGFIHTGIILGKRFNPRFDMTASLDYRDRKGQDGVVIVPGIGSDVFDQNRWSVSLTGNFLLAQRWFLSAELSHFDGDFSSSCTPENVAIVLATEDVTAITLDSVFGGCVYRLNGKGNSAAANLSFALSRHSSLNVGVKYQTGKGDVLDYENTTWLASLIYNF